MKLQGSLGRSRRYMALVSPLKQIRLRRTSMLARAVLMVSFAAATVCPMALMSTAPAFGTLEIAAGQDMGAMPCPMSLCRSEQLSPARHDILKTIHDQLAHAVTVLVPGTAVGSEPRLTRARFASNFSYPRSSQHIPLYLLYASLIR